MVDDTTFSTSLRVPSLILQVDLDRPLPDISPTEAGTQAPYAGIHALIRLHTLPIGVLDAELPESGLDAEALAGQIWQQLNWQINKHLLSDGLPLAASLTSAGLISEQQPGCQIERDRYRSVRRPISIIIPTRDRTGMLRRCIEAITALNYPEYEIVVVDNAPKSNETAELIRSQYANRENIRYCLESRPGLAYARNAGLREVRHPIFAFVDDDAIVDRHWLEEVAIAFRDESVSCVTGYTVPLRLDTEAQALFERFTGFNKGRGFVPQRFGPDHRPRRQPLYPFIASNFGAGVNMAFRTAAVRELGGFDVALGPGTVAGGGEEIDLMFRLIMAGHTIAYEPSVLMFHEHRREFAALKRQMFDYGAGFTAYLTRCLLTRPVATLSLVLRLPDILKYLFNPRSPRNRRKQPGYPSELTRIELRGMLYGPIGYIRSRRRAVALARASL